jgi:short-subunit dehydrogenase
MELRDKLAVVTGASRGIGRALCIALAERGCPLLLTALEEDELGSLAEELSDSDVSVEFRSANLVDDAGRASFLDWVRCRERPPDILVNNAGGGHFGRFGTSDVSRVEQTLILNIHVPTVLIRELLPLLRTRPEAKIVNISSAIARLPYPGLAAYGAAKGFVSSLSETLACELAGTSVSVLCFHPGFAETGFMASAGMDMSRIPKSFIRSPKAVAARIVRAIERDKTWAYSDLSTRFGASLAAALPHGAKTRLFRNLFWRLPT